MNNFVVIEKEKLIELQKFKGKYLKYKSKYLNLLGGKNIELIDVNKFEIENIKLTIKLLGETIEIDCNKNTTLRSIIENEKLLKDRTFIELIFNINFLKDLKIDDHLKLLDLDKTIGYYISKGLILVQEYMMGNDLTQVFYNQMKFGEYVKGLENLQNIIDEYPGSVEFIKINLNGFRKLKDMTREISKRLLKYQSQILSRLYDGTINNQDEDEIKKILEKEGVSIRNFINRSSIDQEFLLTHAIKYNNINAVKYLLRNGAIPKSHHRKKMDFFKLLENKLKNTTGKDREQLLEIGRLANENRETNRLKMEQIKKYKIKQQYEEYKNNTRYVTKYNDKRIVTVSARRGRRTRFAKN